MRYKMTTIARMNNKVNQNIVTWLKTAIGALSKAERSQALVRMKDDNLVDLFPLTDEKALAFYDVLINREIKVAERFTHYDLTDKKTKLLTNLGRNALNKEKTDQYKIMHIGFGAITIDTPEMKVSAPIFLLPVSITPDKDNKQRVKFARNGNLRLNVSLLREVQSRSLDRGQEIQKTIIELLSSSYGEKQPVTPNSIKQIKDYIIKHIKPVFDVLFQDTQYNIDFNRVVAGHFHTEKDAFIHDIQRILEQDKQLQISCLNLFLDDDFNDQRMQSPIEHRQMYDFEKFLTLQSDDSQRHVIKKVLDGQSVIVEGPPGTGKSQTIVNLMRAASANGKTILFIAEKEAAFNSIIQKLNSNYKPNNHTDPDSGQLFDDNVLDIRDIDGNPFKWMEIKNAFRRTKGQINTQYSRNISMADSSFEALKNEFSRIVSMYATLNTPISDAVIDNQSLNIKQLLEYWGPKSTNAVDLNKWVKNYSTWLKIHEKYIANSTMKIWDKHYWDSFNMKRFWSQNDIKSYFHTISNINDIRQSIFGLDPDNLKFNGNLRSYHTLIKLIINETGAPFDPEYVSEVFETALLSNIVRHYLDGLTSEFRHPVKKIQDASLSQQLNLNIAQLLEKGSITSFTSHLDGIIQQFAINYEKDRDNHALTRVSNQIRELQINAGNTIGDDNNWDDMISMFPVWLSTPEKLTTFLSPKPLFDLVIFDEASQLIPTHIIGALYRAKQCVIFGDINQLPPSAFFKRSDSDEQMIPELRTFIQKTGVNLIEWARNQRFANYQLRHYYRGSEELIRVSNKYFYTDIRAERGLFTLPHTTPTSHVSHIYVEPAKTATDGLEKILTELRSLVEGLLHDKSCSEILVITTGDDLKTLADSKLRDLIPEENSGVMAVKPIDVMSIEDVQGIEYSHVIMFFKQPELKNDGTINLSFLGPIAQENGEKRLNVAFTRAKSKVYLITTFLHTNFTTTIDDSSRGAKFLYDYLRDIDVIESATTEGQKINNWERGLYEVLLRDPIMDWSCHFAYGRSSYPITFAFRKKSKSQSDSPFVYMAETDIGRHTREDFDPRDLTSRDTQLKQKHGLNWQQIRPHIRMLDIFKKTKKKLIAELRPRLR